MQSLLDGGNCRSGMILLVTISSSSLSLSLAGIMQFHTIRGAGLCRHARRLPVDQWAVLTTPRFEYRIGSIHNARDARRNIYEFCCLKSPIKAPMIDVVSQMILVAQLDRSLFRCAQIFGRQWIRRTLQPIWHTLCECTVWRKCAILLLTAHGVRVARQWPIGKVIRTQVDK